jgi:hypothetical protein
MLQHHFLHWCLICAVLLNPINFWDDQSQVGLNAVIKHMLFYSWSMHRLSNWNFAKTIFSIGFASNKDPAIWLSGARPPSVSFIGPALA